MFELYKKEVATFFASPTGYLVASVFLVVTWLMLWVIPSEFNIIYGGYATLGPLFDMAPWIFLFLVPAVAMRLLAEERKVGTLELLLIRPMGPWRIVWAKYLAGLTLVLLTIVPTVVFVGAVWVLGSPVGNIDVGATLGCYIALVLLAASYLAISVFASSLTDNQIVAFVIGASLCAVAYVGFDLVASIAPQAGWSAVVESLGIAAHYASVSRGVVDSVDVAYFVALSALFFVGTVLLLRRPMRRTWHNAAIVVAVVAVLGLVANVGHFRLDLTAEKRFTLSNVTKSYVERQPGPVVVQCYLAGDLNPGFRRLRRQITDLCQELSVHSAHGVRLFDVDPNALGAEQAQKFANELAEGGLAGVPVFETKEDGQKTRTIVYPYIKLMGNGKSLWVNMLENIPGLGGEESLNRSIEDAEFKFADALQRLGRTDIAKVAFLEGHGELEDIDVVEATEALAQHFIVDRGKVGGDPNLLEPYKVIIVAKPTAPFSEADKFALDQYAMHGGRILWLIDAVSITIDSLRACPQSIGLPNEVNLNDQLFVYGIRVNQSVIEDMSCGMIPVSVPGADGRSQVVPMPWLYGPLMATNMASAVTRNVAYVHGDFVCPIDTVGEDLRLVRTPLLRSSGATRTSQIPVVAQLSTIHIQPRAEDFPLAHLSLGMLEEGEFPSAFKRRSTPRGAVEPKGGRRDLSVETKMIFVGDGDVIRNDVRFRHTTNPTVVPLGYDEMSRQTYGNKDFIVNAVQYLADDDGLMELRNRTFALRLLDRQKISEGTTDLKVLTLILPLLLIGLFGASVALFRKRLFTKQR